MKNDWFGSLAPDARAHQVSGPLVIEGGEGVFVIDELGKHYIEGMSGLWSTALGFSNERLTQAAERQLRKLPYYHTFGNKPHVSSIELAEKLIAMAPTPMSKVYFVNSGSEANDAIVKLVWYRSNALKVPLRRKFISRQGAYEEDGLVEHAARMGERL